MSTLAIIGGTGPEGLGLALRLCAAGEDVIIGSRQAERAQAAAADITSKVPGARVSGLENAAAAQASELILIAVPYGGQKAPLTALKPYLDGKIVVDTVVPLLFEKGKIGTLSVAEGSAAQEAQALLPQSRVVGAFHNVSAHELADLAHEVPCDVVVVGDDAEAKKIVMALAQKIQGVRAIDGGRLHIARYVEDITAMLLNINRIYKAHSSIRIVGV